MLSVEKIWTNFHIYRLGKTSWIDYLPEATMTSEWCCCACLGLQATRGHLVSAGLISCKIDVLDYRTARFLAQIKNAQAQANKAWAVKRKFCRSQPVESVRQGAFKSPARYARTSCGKLPPSPLQKRFWEKTDCFVVFSFSLASHADVLKG